MVNTFELYWQMSLFGGYKMAPDNYMHIWLVEFRLILQKSNYFILLSKQFYLFSKNHFGHTGNPPGAPNCVHTGNPPGAHNPIVNPSNFIKKLEW